MVFQKKLIIYRITLFIFFIGIASHSFSQNKNIEVGILGSWKLTITTLVGNNEYGYNFKADGTGTHIRKLNITDPDQTRIICNFTSPITWQLIQRDSIKIDFGEVEGECSNLGDFANTVKKSLSLKSVTTNVKFKKNRLTK